MKCRKGWYALLYPDKFIKPTDSFMNSFKVIDGEYYVEYKSRLEYRAFRYADCNPKIIQWSVEPFPIKYIKPTDGKSHRYYIDLVVKFSNDQVFLIEVKPHSQTKMPRKPKGLDKGSANMKSINRYKNDLMTYAINEAKWKAAKQLCEKNNFKFIILTEKELK